MYRKLGLKASFELASRPAKALGDGNDELWELAERALREALRDFAGDEWSVDEGGGAFYGPKIDCKVQDAAGRWLQLASVQLDFQMPRRFVALLWCNCRANHYRLVGLLRYTARLRLLGCRLGSCPLLLGRAVEAASDPSLRS